MGVEGARPGLGAKAPDVAQELVLREDARRVGGELLQEQELLARQVDGLTAQGDRARDPVDDERRAELEEAMVGFFDGHRGDDGVDLERRYIIVTGIRKGR